MTESKVKVLVNLDMSTAFYRPFSEFSPVFLKLLQVQTTALGGAK